MDKQYFIKLLHKYQQGGATNEEKQFVESYYNLFQNEPDVLGALSMEEKKEFETNIKVAIWDNISKAEQGGATISFINKRYIRVAAAAAIFIGVTSGLFFFRNLSSKYKTVATHSAQQLNTGTKPPPQVPMVDHLQENRAIFLPDGSTVILSPGSKLNYPSSFDGMTKREVFLDGQAYFDIKHNPSRPFVVHTGKLETVVLGTAFNIKAIHGEKDITVTVKRGKVRVSGHGKILGVITPNQQITYNTEGVSAALKNIDSDSYLDWKYQDLFIDNLTLSEAARILEGQYKIKVVISDSSIRELRFTATFQKDEKLEQALKCISEFNGLAYTYNKDKSIVTITNNN